MTYDEIIAALNAQQQQNAPQPNLLDASGNPNPSAGLLASSPTPSGPGMTPASMSGALGSDNVQPAVPTPVLGAPAPSPLASTSPFVPAPAPQPSAGLLNPDVSDAGVSSVPQFAAPVNPATAVHHSFIGGLLGKIGHVVKQAGDNFTTNLAGLSDGDLATMSPADIHRARLAGLQGFLDRAAHPSMDARGFRESTFQALGSGVGAGNEAASQYVGQARQAAQYAAQRAQAEQLTTKRAALQAQFRILPTDTPEEVTAKVQQLAAGYTAIGDSQSLNALGQASALFKQPKPPAAPRALEHVETVDPKTGKPIVGWFDSATGQMVNSTAAVVKPEPGARALSVEQQDKSIDRVTKTYDAETKDFQKARGGYEVLQGALANPNLYAPFAMLDAFARVVNPGAIVRPTTLELLKATGSGEDRIRRWASLIEKGQWPSDLTGALNSTIGGIMQQHYTTAQSARKRALARLNTLHVSDADTYLDDLNYGAAPSAPASISSPRPTTAAPTPTTSTTRGNY